MQAWTMNDDLIHVYFDFVREFLPMAFLMENVPGMLWKRHEPALNVSMSKVQSGLHVLDPIVGDARIMASSEETCVSSSDFVRASSIFCLASGCHAWKCGG